MQHLVSRGQCCTIARQQYPSQRFHTRPRVHQAQALFSRAGQASGTNVTTFAKKASHHQPLHAWGATASHQHHQHYHHTTKRTHSRAMSKAMPNSSAQLDRSQDVGNIVLFEHVNLEVPDLEVARLFYGEGLGLTLDPSRAGAQRGGINVMWYNIGRHQFHICKGPVPQRLPPGSAIGLSLPNVAKVAEQLEHVQQVLGDVSVSHLSHHMLEVRDPYGVTFIIEEAGPDTTLPGGQGIAYLLLPCFKGTAASIANFFNSQLGAVTQLSPSNDKCEVIMGPGTKIIFHEQSSLGALSDQAVRDVFDGWHIAMYIADFSTTYQRLASQGLIFNDHPYRDKCYSLQDALRNHQFRFQDIPLLAPSTGGSAKQSDVPTNKAPTTHSSGSAASSGMQLAYRISHEVRSLFHPNFARALYNRGSGVV